VDATTAVVTTTFDAVSERSRGDTGVRHAPAQRKRSTKDVKRR